MKQAIVAIQNRLAEAATQTARKSGKLYEYVDMDWGQADFYSTPSPPIMFPAALIEILSSAYTNEGKHKQLVVSEIQVRIIDMVLANSSAQAPANQKERAYAVFDQLDSTNALLHGWSPGEGFGVLTKVSMQKVNREDGLKEYRLVYSMQHYDTSAIVAAQLVPATPVITVKREK